MKFEEILPLMREGKKARRTSDDSGDYWICGRCGNPRLGIDLFPLIIRMDKNDCAPRTSYDWGIRRFDIMAEDWEIIE